MKFIALLLVIISLSACKVETQTSNEKVNNTASEKEQVVISGNNLSSQEVENFSNELERRQLEKPDTFFEVVKSSKRSGSTILSNLNDDYLYPKKNFYLLIGLGRTDKDNSIQKTDWDAVYFIMSYLSEQKFRVLVNVRATAEHLKLAAEDKDTSVILWSSHGNKGGFYDVDGNKVPYDIFKNKSKGFYQLLLSSCEGRVALDDHYSISGLKTYAWSGLTNSIELKNFIKSDEWTADYGRSLINPINGITCTVKAAKAVMMKEGSREDLYGYGFEKLDDCSARLKTIRNNKVCARGEDGVFKIDIKTLEKTQRFNSLEDCLQ